MFPRCDLKNSAYWVDKGTVIIFAYTTVVQGKVVNGMAALTSVNSPPKYRQDSISSSVSHTRSCAAL